MADSLEQRVREYIDNRCQAKLEKFRKASGAYPDAGIDELGEARLRAIKAEFIYDVWLTEAARRARQISFATHPIKFSHSDAKGTSIFSSHHEGDETEPYVTMNLPLNDVVLSSG